MSIDVNKILEDFKSRMKISGEGESYLVMPFFHRYESDSIPLCFFEENDCLYITDCGSTFEHLQNRYVDPEQYREAIERTKKRFYVKEREDRALYLEYPSDSYLSVEMFTGYFLQAISIIGNIDLFGA